MADHFCANATYTEVESKVSAASAGDRIFVPAGTETWDNFLNLADKQLIGAGQNNTIISLEGLSQNYLRHPKRISGFTFNLMEGNDMINTAVSDGFRIDHCTLHNQVGFGATNPIHIIQAGGAGEPHPYGLIDQNIMINMRILVIGNSVDGGENPCWAEDSTIGTGTNAIFVENNDFSYDGNVTSLNAIDANRGARYVFRHNTVTDCWLETHSIQANQRGTRSWEIYNNTIEATGLFGGLFAAIRLRGGTGVVFNNVISGSFTGGIFLDNDRCFVPHSYPPGNCDGLSDWDETGGYPARDQIGRGKDDAGTFPQPQADEPTYLWNNTFDGSPLDGVVINNGEAVHSGGSSLHIVEGRDYYDSTSRPGYTAYQYPHPLNTDRRPRKSRGRNK